MTIKSVTGTHHACLVHVLVRCRFLACRVVGYLPGAGGDVRLGADQACRTLPPERVARPGTFDSRSRLVSGDFGWLIWNGSCFFVASF